MQRPELAPGERAAPENALKALHATETVKDDPRARALSGVPKMTSTAPQVWSVGLRETTGPSRTLISAPMLVA